jgi:hypothetical protein
MERRRIRITKPKTPVRKTPVRKTPVRRKPVTRRRRQQQQQQQQQQQVVQTVNIGALAPPPKPRRKSTRKPKPPAPKPPPDTQVPVPQPFQTPSVIFRPQFLDKPSVGTEDIKKIIESLVEKENNRLINTFLQRNRDNAPDTPVRQPIPQPTRNYLGHNVVGQEKATDTHDFQRYEEDRGLLHPQTTKPDFEPFASSSGIPTADKPDEEEDGEDDDDDEEATQARRDEPVASSSTAPVNREQFVRQYFGITKANKQKPESGWLIKAKKGLKDQIPNVELRKDPTGGTSYTTEEDAINTAYEYLRNKRLVL